MKSLGDSYEEKAADWLNSQGLELIARNYRAKTGEIDIIAIQERTLVFIEVRARSHPAFAGAAASVTRRKQQRILRTAQCFMQSRRKFSDYPCRFDVIAFEPPQSGSNNEINWIRSAFTA